jgi:UDP-N-acetyl-D-glucosamine dehydrogenase
VLGIAYKKNVDDMRESPSGDLMEKLRDMGRGRVQRSPHPGVPEAARAPFDLKSVVLTPQVARFIRLRAARHRPRALRLRPHPQARELIVDSRGKYLEPAANIVKA